MQVILSINILELLSFIGWKYKRINLPTEVSRFCERTDLALVLEDGRDVFDKEELDEVS